MASPTPGKAIVAAFLVIALGLGISFYVTGRGDSPSAPTAPVRGPASRVDPTATAARPLAPDDYDTSNIKTLVAALVARPPTRERFAAVLAQVRTPRRTNELFRELGRLDFSLALKLAGFTGMVENAKAKAVWGYAEVDPDRALEWALANPQKSPVSTIGNSYLEHWAAGAWGPHRAAVYAFIDRFPPDQAIQTARNDAIAGIELRAVVLRSPREIFEDPRAPALIVSLQSGPNVVGGLPDGRLLALASDWARQEPQAMLEFASRVTDPLLRRPLLDAAMGPYVQLNPAEAFEWAMRVDPDQSLGIVSRGINEWINRTNDPEAALAWVKADASRQAHVDGVAGIVAARLGDKNYLRAYEIALAITTESTRQKALESVALYQRKNDAHFDHVKRSGNPELMSALVLHLAAKQPDRAAELIALMPPGPLKTAAQERLREARKGSGN